MPGHGTSGVRLRIALGLKRPLPVSTRAIGPFRSPKCEISVQQTSAVPGTSRPLAYPLGWMIVLPKTSSGWVPSGRMRQSVWLKSAPLSMYSERVQRIRPSRVTEGAHSLRLA